MRHNKCIKCKGGKTPDELMAEDAAIVDEYENRLYDDSFLDDALEYEWLDGFYNTKYTSESDKLSDEFDKQFDDEDYP